MSDRKLSMLMVGFSLCASGCAAGWLGQQYPLFTAVAVIGILLGGAFISAAGRP